MAAARVANLIRFRTHLERDRTLPGANHRDTTRTSYLPLPPEEVLFRRRNAPERYEEDDIYFAHENLDPQKQPLPDSDLLKAVHTYASDFYGAGLGKHEEGMVSFGSMDETALMAVGILLEEAVGRLVEGTGDLVFVEGSRRGEDEVLEQLRRKRQARKNQSAQAETVDSGAEDESGDTDAEGSSSDLPSMAESSASGRMRKRRRIEDEGSDPRASTELGQTFAVFPEQPTISCGVTTVMEGLVLALSDQQLIVGLAIFVAGFAQHCSISVYHFSIVFDLAWFSSNTHITTLPVLRARLVDEPSLLKWRVSLMILLALFLCIGITLEGHRDWYESYNAPAQCLFNDLPGIFSGKPARWSVASVFLIVPSYSVDISSLYYNDASHSFFFEKPIRRLKTSQGTVHSKRCLWRTAGGARAIIAFTILRPVEMMSAKL
ncbi:MAG: hypothetical protein Q9173_002205 [Seirophora scorigena]